MKVVQNMVPISCPVCVVFWKPIKTVPNSIYQFYELNIWTTIGNLEESYVGIGTADSVEHAIKSSLGAILDKGHDVYGNGI